MFILRLCNTYRITEGRIIIACDNKGAIQRIQKGQPKVQNKHYDYLSAIASMLTHLPVKTTFIHVDGHKNETTSLQDLTLLESMNINADSHAKAKASVSTPTEYSTDQGIYGEWAVIKHRSADGNITRIHSNLDSTLYDFLTTNTSKQYWTRKLKIPQDVANTINWSSLGNAFCDLTKTKQKEILKWHSGFCGTNAALLLRKQTTSAECPGCTHPNETTEHILKCKAKGATETWTASIRNLTTWMETHDAAPEIVTAITDGLNAWRSNQPTEQKRFTLPFLTNAINIQNRIGWKGFLYGFTAIHWEKAQQTYLEYKSRRTSGKRWITALIKMLWETIGALWRYRNGLIHEETNTPLKKVNALLNITILKELQYGQSNLPRNYAYLFKKQSTEVLKTSINKKNSGYYIFG